MRGRGLTNRIGIAELVLPYVDMVCGVGALVREAFGNGSGKRVDWQPKVTSRNIYFVIPYFTLCPMDYGLHKYDIPRATTHAIQLLCTLPTVLAYPKQSILFPTYKVKGNGTRFVLKKKYPYLQRETRSPPLSATTFISISTTVMHREPQNNVIQSLCHHYYQ